MSSTSYRDQIYDKYATVQAPDWCNTGVGVDGGARAALRRFADWLPADRNARILDLGCGAGHLLSALKEAGYNDVLGVDGSPECVSIARIKGLHVEHADVREFCRSVDHKFDVICLFDVIEHFHKSEALDIFRLIWTRLAPHGALVVQTPNAVSPWVGQYRYGDFTHEVVFTPECLKNVLGLCGFKGVAVREVAPIVHGCKSALRWFAWNILWLACAGWHLAESGNLCGGIYTKNMLARAIKNDGSI